MLDVGKYKQLGSRVLDSRKESGMQCSSMCCRCLGLPEGIEGGSQGLLGPERQCFVLAHPVAGIVPAPFNQYRRRINNRNKMHTR